MGQGERGVPRVVPDHRPTSKDVSCQIMATRLAIVHVGGFTLANSARAGRFLPGSVVRVRGWDL